MFWPAFYYHGNEPFRFSFVGIKRWNIAVRICSLANEDLRFVFIISGLSSFLILAAMFPPPPFLEMVVFFSGKKGLRWKIVIMQMRTSVLSSLLPFLLP